MSADLATLLAQAREALASDSRLCQRCNPNDKHELIFLGLVEAVDRLQRERDELRQWRVDVTSALCVAFPGGVAYADAAKKAKALAEERNAAWEAIQRGWEIEPREYFEAEAPQNGFRHPLAQAIHHLWKRDVKVEAAEAEAARHRADALLMLHAYETDNRPPMDILTRLRGLRAELLLGIR